MIMSWEMKKIFILMVCLTMALEAAAQSHSHRDTTYVRYEQFDFDAWVWEDPEHHGKVCDQYPIMDEHNCVFGNADIVQYNYTDNPAGMEVVGLSAAVVLNHGMIFSTVPPEYLLLYEATPDTFELKAMEQWYETDTAGRPEGRYLVNPMYCHSTNSDTTYPDTLRFAYDSWTIKIYDIYFEKPVTVYDSFYVGGTCYFSRMYPPTEPIFFSMNGYLFFSTTFSGVDTTCFMPSLWKVFDYNGAIHEWYWMPTNQFMMVLPIIRVVDTSFAGVPECPEVTGMFALGNNTDTVTLQWAYDSLHGEFEVSYGPDGTAPGDGTVATVFDNRWQFTDVAYSDTLMVAYVRTVCREYDTLRWSGWSSPMNFRLHYVDTTTHHEEGIEVPEEGDLSRFVRLMPNPASGSVLVMSSYGMERVEVYDARGGKVYDSPAEGTTAGFDVSSWAKGAYVVHVRTHAGTAAKRLVVQ